MKYYTEEEIVQLYKDLWFREVYKFYKLLLKKDTKKDRDAFQIAMNIVLLNFNQIEESKFNHQTETLIALTGRIILLNKETRTQREVPNVVRVSI